MASGGLHICVSSTSFQKKWHQLASTASDRKGAKFNMIFHDSTPKNFFSKLENKAEFICLDDSEVLSSDLSGLKISAASMTSLASTASMTSTASFHQKIYWSWWFDQPKHPIFHRYLILFLTRLLRPADVIFFEN